MENYVFSKFNYYQQSCISNHWLIYNSLEKKIVKLPNLYAQAIGIAVNGPQTSKMEYIPCDKNVDEKLAKYGIIVPENYDENAAAHLAYLNEVSEPVLRLTIVPTYACNFRCPYCYQDHEHSIIMSEEIQQGIIKYVRKHISKYTAVEISWFGGEPLLCLDIILRINSELKKLCNDRYKLFRSSITTNGYYLSKNAFERLFDVGVTRYFITIDGLAQEHDRQRYLASKQGSFETIINNLINIKTFSKTKKFVINIRSNISKENIDNFDEYLSFMEKHFSDDSRFAFFVRPVYDWGGESIGEFKENLLENKAEKIIMDKLLLSNCKLNYLEFFFDLTGNIVCYASKINSFVINPDGSVNKCTCAETGGRNLIGRLLPNGELEIDKSLMGQWCSQYYESSNCNHCYMLGLCLKSYCVMPQVIRNERSCACFIAKNICGEMLMLIDKCDEKYCYIVDITNE